MPISIQDLHPTGHELFVDNENYLQDLSPDGELNRITGGTGSPCIVITLVVDYTNRDRPVIDETGYSMW
jgi:hypothetical protein